ncbi:MAG: colanic acid exporter [Desulfobacterales bacterium PC51MH44]|nr:MAG: colanic acid exporter [Desulfobacterales bacterium PC51MH44]
MSLKSQAVSGVKWSGASMGVMTALQFVTLAVLARLLSPSDFGLMGMIMVVVGFAQAFADMGISNAIIHRQDATRNQLSSLYWLNIIAGIITFCVICASAPLVVEFYHEPRLHNLLYLTAAIFLITPFGQQFQILMQKKLRFNELAKIEIATSIVNSVVAIVLAFSGFGVYSLIWGQLAGTSTKVLMLFSTGWRNWRPGFHFSRHDLSNYLSFGLYQMGERSINYLNSNIDYLLIGSMLGAKSLGYYTLAYNLIIRPSIMINPVITKVAFPVFSRVQNETDRLKRGYLKVLQLLSTVNLPMMIGLAVIAPIAVPVIFGEQWLPSIILIQILTIVGLLRSTASIVGSLLMAKGRADLGFKWNLVLTITQIPGLYLGIKLGGMVGVAIAYAILQCIYAIFNYLVLIRILLGPCLREYIQRMWPSLWTSGAMAIAVLFSGIFLQNMPYLPLLIIQILCGAAVYIGLMMYSQKMFVNEIKDMIFNEGVTVAK